MSDPNGWPDPSRPGVPINSEVDGWHWCSDTELPLAARLWDAKKQRWNLGNGIFYTVELMESWGWVWEYLGPCLTPAEVAAREFEARRAAWEHADKARAKALDEAKNAAYCAAYEGKSPLDIAKAIDAIRALKEQSHDR